MGPPGPTRVPGPGQSECNVPNHLTSPAPGVPSPPPDQTLPASCSPALRHTKGQAGLAPPHTALGEAGPGTRTRQTLPASAQGRGDPGVSWSPSGPSFPEGNIRISAVWLSQEPAFPGWQPSAGP